MSPKTSIWIIIAVFLTATTVFLNLAVKDIKQDKADYKAFTERCNVAGGHIMLGRSGATCYAGKIPQVLEVI